jgi:hypothetical protein
MLRRKQAAAVTLSAEEAAGIKEAHPSLRRLVEDAELRANLDHAVAATKRAYARFTAAKTPTQALLEDRKLQAEIRKALDSLRDVTAALADAPGTAGAPARKRRRPLRKLMLLGGVGAAAVAAIPPLRSKLLDALFGAEEEFQYSPPPAPAPAPAAPADTPVSA